MSVNFNVDDELRRAELEIEAENLMAKHCYYHAACWNGRELDTIWVTEDKDVSWAQGHGRRPSLERFRAAYVNGSEENCKENMRWLLKEYPFLEGHDPFPLMELAIHTLTTPVFETAEDLQSVKGWWYTPGSLTSNLNWGGHQEGNWLWERYAVDFTMENGKLKMHRAVVFPDLMIPMDADGWTAEESDNGPPPMAEPEDGPVLRRFPHDIPGDFHRNWSATQLPQDTPPQPEAYDNMNNTFWYDGECK